MRVMNELYLCFEKSKRLRRSGGNIFLIPFAGCNMVTVPTGIPVPYVVICVTTLFYNVSYF